LPDLRRKGRGAVFGNGVGVVVLKRFADALADGDTVHAVIRGTPINNDGAQKAGYTAPSVVGQAMALPSEILGAVQPA
jgi:acyl transferase domain-containing protein